MKSKTYLLDGYSVPQSIRTKIRIVKTKTGVVFQEEHLGPARGEFTQSLWVDIPVYDEDEVLLGYTLGETDAS